MVILYTYLLGGVAVKNGSTDNSDSYIRNNNKLFNKVIKIVYC